MDTQTSLAPVARGRLFEKGILRAALDGAEAYETNLRAIASSIVLLAAIFAGWQYYEVVIARLTPQFWGELATTQFKALVGLPAAGLAAFFVVLALRIADGPIEWEIIGFKFKGAAGPVILWLACFLGIAAALNILWS